MKNKLQPTRTSSSRNFQCKKAPCWLSKFFHFGTENRADQLKKPPCMMQDSTLLKPFQISNASVPPASWQPPPFSGKWRYAKIISKLPQASEFHYHGLQNLPASSYIMKFLLKNCYFCCQLNCKLYFHLISL